MAPTDTATGAAENQAVRRKQPTDREALVRRAEQAEEALSHFFEKSLDLQCVAGFDGYFKRLNSTWTTHLGWSRKELTDKPFIAFVHPDDLEATAAVFENLSADVPTILFENRYRHRDGSYRWLQWNARPASDHSLIYATARDVTRSKSLERQIMEIADREKERLGLELHDGLCQSLAGVAALSSTLSRMLATSGETAASAMAADVSKLLGEAIGQARDLARGLGPVGLNRGSLADALRALARNVEQFFRVSCSVECEGRFDTFPYEVKLHLFRISQEAVRNAVTHGQGDRIEIGLTRTNGRGVLSIHDHGVGISETAHDHEGIGLHTMATRARLIGGSLKLRQGDPRGTVVVCSFPLP
jgi:PAS domain S-box-containing protein